MRPHCTAGLQRKRGVQNGDAPLNAAASRDVKVDMNRGMTADVVAEADRVGCMTEADATTTPIIIKDLHKVYPGQDGGPPKVRAEGRRAA